MAVIAAGVTARGPCLPIAAVTALVAVIAAGATAFGEVAGSSSQSWSTSKTIEPPATQKPQKRISRFE